MRVFGPLDSVGTMTYAVATYSTSRDTCFSCRFGSDGLREMGEPVGVAALLSCREARQVVAVVGGRPVVQLGSGKFG